MRHIIEACDIEFEENGNTIWVNSPLGATMLRIKCTGKITTDTNCINIVPHSDMMVQGDIHICMPVDSQSIATQETQ